MEGSPVKIMFGIGYSANISNSQDGEKSLEDHAWDRIGYSANISNS